MILPVIFSTNVLMQFIIDGANGLKIDLADRNLITVPRDLDVSVTVLVLRKNLLHALNASSFYQCPLLTKIDVARCQVKYVQDGTFDMQDKLYSINLRYNKITQLPSHFGPSTNTLEKLHIWQGYSTGKIFTYPYFFAFTKLEVLEMGGRNLESYNVTILPTNLKKLSIKYAMLSTFPPFGKSGLHLQAIDLANNLLSSIPQIDISTLTMLNKLNCNRNRLTSIPDFSHLKMLRILSMEHNQFITLPRGNIAGLKSIQQLKLAWNLIGTMPNISYLSNLTYVTLNNNNIRYVPESCLYGLTSRLTLYLNDNDIKEIEDIMFLWVELYLHNNELPTLPIDVQHQGLESISLSGNPLMCNMFLCWVRMHHWWTELTLLDTPSCAGPPNFNGNNVMEIHPVEMKCYQGIVCNHFTLQWCHNDRKSSNHQPHDCLLNRLFRHRSKKISKLRVTGLCERFTGGRWIPLTKGQ